MIARHGNRRLDLRGDLSRPLDEFANFQDGKGQPLPSSPTRLALLSGRDAEIIRPDVCVIGSVSEMRGIAAIAETRYLTVARHNPVGRLAAAMNTQMCAAQPISRRWTLSHTFTRGKQKMPVSAHMDLRPDRSGCGLWIDEDALQIEDYIH